MTDFNAESIKDDPSDKVDGIADQVRGDIQLGQVTDDVSSLLKERLEEAGVSIRDEDVEALADEIEKDASS